MAKTTINKKVCTPPPPKKKSCWGVETNPLGKTVLPVLVVSRGGGDAPCRRVGVGGSHHALRSDGHAGGRHNCRDLKGSAGKKLRTNKILEKHFEQI